MESRPAAAAAAHLWPVSTNPRFKKSFRVLVKWDVTRRGAGTQEALQAEQKSKLVMCYISEFQQLLFTLQHSGE